MAPIENRRDQHDRAFRGSGAEGEHRVDPEEGEVGLGRGLDDGGIGLARGTEGAEEEGAGHDGNRMAAAKTASFHAASGTKGMPVFGQFVVLAARRWPCDDAAGHGPVA
jgi:hypothetical protein